ncbi:hypothetical protein GUITHDRAFT_100514 [Guillardia theta CCMP2712]|uniref:Uncharacterized protein n=1 Tax=Guillardia theta (strain CCMP2712) TaxID=905079 RepID=L1JZI7_GUITC|nr:hypothetical protein GUITHDRAFT_100514 [Guillardia theta CCMP2712]EKX53528.1 hypothetical protein GUITHDRAFT_100514 [Guillardia theta CCMP2712]|eukprot:XP_005840508.1 hypothetical protein GUITHDRAFT_100514 [Guillardia theta CCMP2712]
MSETSKASRSIASASVSIVFQYTLLFEKLKKKPSKFDAAMEVEAARMKQESMDIRLKTSLMKGAFEKQTDMRAALFHDVISSCTENSPAELSESSIVPVQLEEPEDNAVPCDILPYLKAQVYDAVSGLNMDQDVCRHLKLLGLVNNASLSVMHQENMSTLMKFRRQEYDLYFRSQPYNMSPSEAIRTFGSDRELLYATHSSMQVTNQPISQGIKPLHKTSEVDKKSTQRVARPRPKWPKSISLSGDDEDNESRESPVIYRNLSKTKRKHGTQRSNS